MKERIGLITSLLHKNIIQFNRSIWKRFPKSKTHITYFELCFYLCFQLLHCIGSDFIFIEPKDNEYGEGKQEEYPQQNPTYSLDVFQSIAVLR